MKMVVMVQMEDLCLPDEWWESIVSLQECKHIRWIYLICFTHNIWINYRHFI